MTRRKAFKWLPLHLDVAAVLLHHKDKVLDAVAIHDEIFNDCEHPEWELSFVKIMMCMNAIRKRGYAEGGFGGLQANDRTVHIFDLMGVRS